MTRKRFEKLLRAEYTWLWVHAPLSFNSGVSISKTYRELPNISRLAQKVGGYDALYSRMFNP